MSAVTIGVRQSGAHVTTARFRDPMNDVGRNSGLLQDSVIVRIGPPRGNVMRYNFLTSV